MDVTSFISVTYFEDSLALFCFAHCNTRYLFHPTLLLYCISHVVLKCVLEYIGAFGGDAR
jgi:hypothetical protein